jgi:hypothetical protein
MLRDRLALLFIRFARRLTTWGFTDDRLEHAEIEQTYWIRKRKETNE